MLLWMFIFNKYPLLKSYSTKSKTQGDWKEEAMDRIEAAATQMHVASQTLAFSYREAVF